MNDDWSALASLVTEKTSATGAWETDPFLGDHKITRFIDEFRDDDWYSTAITLKGNLGFADLALTATHFDRDIAYAWDNMAYSQYKDRYWGGGNYYEQYYAGNPYYYNYNNYEIDEYHLIDVKKLLLHYLNYSLSGESLYGWKIKVNKRFH